MKISLLLSGTVLILPLWLAAWAQSSPSPDRGDTPSPSSTAMPKPQPEVPREAENDSYIRKGTIYGKITRPSVPVFANDAKYFIDLRQLGEENPEYSFCSFQDGTKGGHKLPLPYELDWTIDPWIPKEHLKYAISIRVYEHGRLSYKSVPQVFNVESKWQRFDLNLVPSQS